MEYYLESGHRGGGDGSPRSGCNVGGGSNSGHRGGGDSGGGRPRGGNNVCGGGNRRRPLDINSWRRWPRFTNRRREQRWMIFTPSFHAVYLGFNGLLYALIQIKYQNQSISPFETHTAMTSSWIALCVYFCAAIFQKILVKYDDELDDSIQYDNELDDSILILNHVLFCSGILSPISNILVFLPKMVDRIVIPLFVFATTILLAYYVVKLISNCISERNNRNNNNATPTSESVALEMSTGINYNAATTSESHEISIEINNETIRNNNDAVEMVLETISQAPHTPFQSFLNQGFGD